MIDVVFFSDRAMLPGLHVSLVSMIQANQNTPLQIHVFTSGVDAAEKLLIQQTVNRSSTNRQQTVSFSIRDYDAKAPPGANALHGNEMTYGRLFIADLLPQLQNCIYLDSDLVIAADLSDLEEASDSEAMLSVDGTGTREHSLDRGLFRDAGLDLTGPCFNAGVLRLNLDRWRAESAFAKCIGVAKQYPGKFLSADQSLLNVAFADDFCAFGSRFNTQLTPSASTITKPENHIYHFVASPKPWDLFGQFIHRNCELWAGYYRQTAIGDVNPRKYRSWSRSYSIRRSILRELKIKKRR